MNEVLNRKNNLEQKQILEIIFIKHIIYYNVDSSMLPLPPLSLTRFHAEKPPVGVNVGGHR